VQIAALWKGEDAECSLTTPLTDKLDHSP
jgi:hypothetical protein